MSISSLTKPQQRAIEETKAIFPQLQQRIKDQLAKLQQQVVSHGSLMPLLSLCVFTIYQEQSNDQISPEELVKAQEAVAGAEKAIKQAV